MTTINVVVNPPAQVNVSAPEVQYSATVQTSGLQGPAGVGVPAGGTTGQALTKASATNYDTTWTDVVTPTGTQTLTNKTLTSPTINDGTANGVAYLNGSKVLTTGSALTFDSSNTLSITSNLPRLYFYKTGTLASTNFVGYNGGMIAYSSDVFSDANSSGHQWFIDGSERMRITSAGNVGIGTSSPTNILDVNANSIRVRTARTPASATATGTQGEIAWDADYIYVCVSTNTWKRSALSTW